MRHILTICIVAIANAMSTANAAEANTPHVDAMYAAINSGNPVTAMAEADQVIAGFQAKYREPDTLYLCGETAVENLMNMTFAAQRGRNGVSVPTDWCAAHFVKGFAAIDLNQPALAEAELLRAVEMAPYNAHYLNEYAELFKSRREWQRSYDLFAQAESVASIYPETSRKEVHARSLRGMGYTKIELGDLNAAEWLFKRSLQLIPGHTGSLTELKYIADQRQAATK